MLVNVSCIDILGGGKALRWWSARAPRGDELDVLAPGEKMDMEQEKQQRGCGCAAWFVVGFAVWLVVVMGPWFPRRARRAWHVGVAGTVKQTILLAVKERHPLRVVVLDKAGQEVHKHGGRLVVVSLVSLQPDVVSVEKGMLVARRAGPARVMVKGTWTLGKAAPKAWTLEQKVWVASWELKSRVLLSRASRKAIGRVARGAWGRSKMLPGVRRPRIPYHHVVVWRGEPHVLTAHCRWPGGTHCRGWQRRRVGSTMAWLALRPWLREAGKPVHAASFACLRKDKLWFVDGFRGRRFVSRLMSYDMKTHHWAWGPQVPGRQQNSSVLCEEDSLWLWGGASSLQWRGGRLLQRFSWRTKQWTRVGLLPDRTWDCDSVARVGGQLFAVNRRGRVCQYEEKQKVWASSWVQGQKKRDLARQPVLVGGQGGLLLLWTHPTQALRTVWRYRRKTKRWVAFATLPDGFLPGAQWALVAGQLWAVGSTVKDPNHLRILRWPTLWAKKAQRDAVTKPTSRPASRPVGGNAHH